MFYQVQCTILVSIHYRFKYIFQKNIYRCAILKLAKVSELVDFDLRQFVFLPDIVFEIEFFYSDSLIFFYTSDDKSNLKKNQEDFSKNK